MRFDEIMEAFDSTKDKLITSIGLKINDHDKLVLLVISHDGHPPKVQLARKILNTSEGHVGEWKLVNTGRFNELECLKLTAGFDKARQILAEYEQNKNNNVQNEVKSVENFPIEEDVTD